MWNPPPFDPGWVWLVGAGPGDPGLLTLLTHHALGKADVVVYDALVDPSVLELARSGAVLEYAGKRGGKPGPKQRDISLGLIAHARRGKRVLRLKGGDPFVFGRGAEEALALVAAGIPFRVVPGVSAGIGGLAYAGIPLTHRETNHAVTFVTGHDTPGAPATCWRDLSRASPVLVIYMGLNNLPHIVSQLRAAGRPTCEPVAIVSRATTEAQTVLETTLERAVPDAARARPAAPSLIVVGEVVRMRAGLDWQAAMSGQALDPNPLRTRRVAETA